MNTETVCVVIPTRNEADNIGFLIHSLESLECIDWIQVVDDSSNDGTLEKLTQLQKKFCNLHLHVRPNKLGFGTALRKGIALALESFPFQRLVQMDADLSHNPKFIPQMLSEKAELVIGSRYIKGGKIMGWSTYRKITSRTANFLTRASFGTEVRDITSGFRVYSRCVAEVVAAKAMARGYEFEVESFLLAKKHGFSIAEVPITFVDRKKGRSKMGKSEILRFLSFVLRNANI